MVPGKLSVPGRLTNLDKGMAGAYCIRCRSGLFEHFFSFVYLLSFLSPSLGDGPI